MDTKTKTLTITATRKTLHHGRTVVVTVGSGISGTLAKLVAQELFKAPENALVNLDPRTGAHHVSWTVVKPVHSGDGSCLVCGAEAQWVGEDGCRMCNRRKEEARERAADEDGLTVQERREETSFLTFDAALAEYCEGLRKTCQESWNERTPGLATVTIECMRGRRYVRVVRNDSLGGRSAMCFVDMKDGNIWKAATWRGPALNFPRGNIYNLEHHRYLPHGY